MGTSLKILRYASLSCLWLIFICSLITFGLHSGDWQKLSDIRLVNNSLDFWGSIIMIHLMEKKGFQHFTLEGK